MKEMALFYRLLYFERVHQLLYGNISHNSSICLSMEQHKHSMKQPEVFNLGTLGIIS